MASKTRTNIRLEEACAAYMRRITNEGQAKASIVTAHYALARFRRAVGTRRDPNPLVHLIDSKMVDDYCFGENGIRRGIQAISFNRYRSVLIKFFDYGLVMRWCDTNPMDGIPAARPDSPKQRLMLNASELIALLDYATIPVERIGCALGMNTGLRGNDIRHLTVFDASVASGTIQTEIRKTRKMDAKPITPELHPELVRWLDCYADVMGLPDRGHLPDDWLLVPAFDYHVVPRTGETRFQPRPHDVHTHPWRLVQRPLERMGYPTKGEGFHTLRRSSARALFETLRSRGEGKDHALMVVQDYLNHSSTIQTQTYLGLNHERTIRDSLLRSEGFLSTLARVEQQRASNTDTVLGEIKYG